MASKSRNIHSFDDGIEIFIFLEGIIIEGRKEKRNKGGRLSLGEFLLKEEEGHWKRQEKRPLEGPFAKLEKSVLSVIPQNAINTVDKWKNSITLMERRVFEILIADFRSILLTRVWRFHVNVQAKIADTASGRDCNAIKSDRLDRQTVNSFVGFVRNVNGPVSFGSVSAALSDRREFPLFYRTVSPDSSHNSARVAFVNRFNWKTVTALSQNEDVYSLGVNGLVTELERANITCKAAITFAETDFKDQLKRLRVSTLKLCPLRRPSVSLPPENRAGKGKIGPSKEENA
ncbi:hypothetical protein AAG570_004044 [Ranatra chinensis]|uniref:Receptor ligand binding region domain-containing protein n=1 Tax=Ranatra chinensis TaxID=642074 RepID=A0ABD0Y2P2_9HEMI